MAYEITRKYVIDQKKKPLGVALPLVPTSQNLFDVNYTTEEQIADNLLNFFSTRRGERFMNSNYGTSLIGKCFEATDIKLQDIRQIVEYELETWFPYVETVDLEAYTDDKSEEIKHVKLYWKLAGETASKELFFPL